VNIQFDLNLLRVALALYEEKSVGEAARKLGMSQPATSRALAKLREAFEDELFLRAGYQMFPSPKGLALALSAREVLRNTTRENLIHSDFEPLTTTTTFSIAVNEVQEWWMLPELIKILKVQAPQARIRSVSPVPEQLRIRLETGDIDLAFGPFTNLNRSEFIRRKIADTGVVCLLRSDHPFTGNVLSREEYAGFPHVEVGREEMRPFWDHLLAKNKLKRRIVFSITHVSALPGILKSSNAIVTIAATAAAYFSKSDPKLRVVKAPAKITLPGYQYWH
jgi:DNA-binding transcriptional LysR family regulator